MYRVIETKTGYKWSFQSKILAEDCIRELQKQGRKGYIKKLTVSEIEYQDIVNMRNEATKNGLYTRY